VIRPIKRNHSCWTISCFPHRTPRVHPIWRHGATCVVCAVVCPLWHAFATPHGNEVLHWASHPGLLGCCRRWRRGPSLGACDGTSIGVSTQLRFSILRTWLVYDGASKFPGNDCAVNLLHSSQQCDLGEGRQNSPLEGLVCGCGIQDDILVCVEDDHDATSSRSDAFVKTRCVEAVSAIRASRPENHDLVASWVVLRHCFPC